jgi:hypothetical protein
VELWPEGVKGRNFEGDTPLHLAASSNGNRDMVAFLVECWPERKETRTRVAIPSFVAASG